MDMLILIYRMLSLGQWISKLIKHLLIDLMQFRGIFRWILHLISSSIDKNINFAKNNLPSEVS